MTIGCAAVGCTNSQSKNPGLSFYRFPKDVERRDKWIAAVGRANPSNPSKAWEPSTTRRLCSAHFISGKKSNNPRLPDYVPSIFGHVSSRGKRLLTRQHQKIVLFNQRQYPKKERIETTEKQQDILQLGRKKDHPLTQDLAPSIFKVASSQAKTKHIPGAKSTEERVLRLCYVPHCNKSDYSLELWQSQRCSKHGTYHADRQCDCPPPFKFFGFPGARESAKARKAWKEAIGRRDPDNPSGLLEPPFYMFVCSDHFVDGEPSGTHPYPKLNLIAKKISNKRCLTGNATAAHTKKRSLQNLSSQETGYMFPGVSDSGTGEGDILNNGFDLCSIPSKTQILMMKFLIYTLLASIRKLKSINSALQDENNFLKLKTPKRVTRGCTMYQSLATTDNDVGFFTGITTKSLFLKLHTYLRPYVQRRWMGSKPTGRYQYKENKFNTVGKLCTIDEFLLTLMKLRLGLLNHDLASRFKISTILCSQIFHGWLETMSRILGKTVLWPSREQVLGSKPAQFAELPNLRAVIDVCEIIIPAPKDSTIEEQTWSNYKHQHTGKFLIGIAPNSAVIFVSSFYGGSTSDRDLVVTSGLLERCDPDDMIRANKRFNIKEECDMLSIKLHGPPELYNEAIDSNLALIEYNKHVAQLNTLIDKVMTRFKRFRILSAHIPINLVSSLDKICIVCAALTNFRNPIYKDKA